MTLRLVTGIISALLRAVVYPVSGRQVLPERLWDPHYRLAVGNVQLREQLGFVHRITLHEKIIAFLVQAGRATVASIAAKESQRQSRPLTSCNMLLFVADPLHPSPTQTWPSRRVRWQAQHLCACQNEVLPQVGP